MRIRHCHTYLAFEEEEFRFRCCCGGLLLARKFWLGNLVIEIAKWAIQKDYLLRSITVLMNDLV